MAKITKDVNEISDHAPREAFDPTPTNFRYVPQNLLPDPLPKPGWRYCWIRVSVLGQADQANWSAMTREGYRPVMAESVPELSGMQDEYAPGPFAKQGFIEHRGNVLCIIPEGMAAAKEKYYQEMSRNAVRATSQKAREYGGDDSVHVSAQIKAGRGPINSRPTA